MEWIFVIHEQYSFDSDLDNALLCLSREDPSLRVSLNNETGQVCEETLPPQHEISLLNLFESLLGW